MGVITAMAKVGSRRQAGLLLTQQIKRKPMEMGAFMGETGQICRHGSSSDAIYC